MTLRTNAPVVATITLNGTVQDQEDAATWFLALCESTFRGEKALQVARNVPALQKFLMYRKACARAISC